MNNVFPKKYICASNKYNTIEEYIPLPLLRRNFNIKKVVKSAEILISALGYYELHINGKNITKGEMAPYRSNPDHYVYFDKYNVNSEISNGENVIGIILGNGIQNSIVETWDFRELPWRSAPQVSFSLEITYDDGETETIISDENVKCFDSPIIFNDFHFGEYYDARLEIENWDMPGFDDANWRYAITTVAPRGEAKLCDVEPIIIRQEINPVEIISFEDGYIYDFGENNAGLCRLKIDGFQGQKIILQYFETLVDGKPYVDNIRFKDKSVRFQEDEYICKGNVTEIHTPRFTYHGFRYVYVKGVSVEQAKMDLLTFLVIGSNIKANGKFRCDDEIVNRIQEITLRSDFSNFHYFPTDCPQREKNGWTADAALSAEQMLINMFPEKSYKEWLLNIYRAMKPNGQLPGIVPTGTWGYEWGNGPGWDNVIVYLPYYTYRYRGDIQILKDSAIPLMRYLTYLYSRLDENDLMEIGLGDWVQVGKIEGGFDTPLIVTDSILTVDIANKAAFIYDVLKMPAQKLYAETLASRVRKAIRAKLINYKSMTVYGETQTSQAMGIYYGMFEDMEKEIAIKRLIEYINLSDDHMNVGVLGGRVIFRVLAENGYAELAYKMITCTDFPSYGNWIVRGATTLWECFHSEESGIMDSLNHHFWGDVSAWFYTYLGGIMFNPDGKDVKYVDIKPCFIEKLNFVKASFETPCGRVVSNWQRDGDVIRLSIIVPDSMNGKIVLNKGYCFENDDNMRTLMSGEYTIYKK